MATSFRQTDAASTCGDASVYCSGGSGTGSNEDRACIVGGTAGTSEITISLGVSATNQNKLWFEMDNIDDYDGASGTWTVNLDVTTTNHQLEWEAIYICRINSSCTNQETLGSTTGIAQLLTATPLTQTVTQSSSTTITAGDKIMVICVFNNAQAMVNAAGITPSLLIDAPGTIEGEAGGQHYYHHYYRSVVTLMSKVKGFLKGLWEQRPADLKVAA
jgi:hypothetical protein